MPTYTPRLNLPLPAGNENVSRQAHLDLVNAIDAAAETPDDAQAKVDALAGAGNTKTVKALDDEVIAHLADNAPHAGVLVPQIAVYGGTTTDPDTTTDALLLTSHANCPTATFYFIQTFFYSTKTGNRAQVAVKYNGGDDMYFRQCVSGVWTAWNKVSKTTDYVRQPGYGTTSGTNTYTVTLSPAPTSLVDGLCIAIKIGITNTGAATLNVNSLGAKSIVKSDESAFASGDLVSGRIYTFRYNGTSFILQGEGGGLTLFVGDVQLINNSASASIASTDTVVYGKKLKETKVDAKGTVRVKFTAQQNLTLGNTVLAKVYINGVARGTERSCSDGSTSNPITYTEDFAVNKGDLVQIYGYTKNSGYTATVNNFIISAADLGICQSIL
jgi:hypothetical protein